MSVTAAKIVDKKDGEVFWFASIDGENWIGVSCDPCGAAVKDVEFIINGSGRPFRPMMATRGFISRQGAVFLE